MISVYSVANFTGYHYKEHPYLVFRNSFGGSKHKARMALFMQLWNLNASVEARDYRRFFKINQIRQSRKYTLQWSNIALGLEDGVINQVEVDH